MTRYTFQNPKLIDYRRANRSKSTDAERKLWKYLRDKQLSGYKFQRQYSVGNFILDFYCPKARFGIELDGGQHNEESTMKYDKLRTEYISSFNIKVIRFWDNDVLKNTEGVVEVIIRKLKEL